MTTITEALYLIREIKISVSERLWLRRIYRYLNKTRHIDIYYGALRGNITPTVEIIFGLLLLSVTFFGPPQQNNLDWVAQAGFFFVGVYRILTSASNAFNHLLSITNSSPSIRLVSSFLNQDTLVPERTAYLAPPLETLDIHFDKVSFAYNKETPILLEVQFTIEKGEVTYIYGPSGSGKSTIVDLIAGLISPKSGCLKIGDQGFLLKDLDYKLWRRKIGYVSQEPKLQKGSLADNIDIHGEASEATKRYFCDLLGVSEFLDMDTAEIAEGGSNFSGGQRRRIAIVRELIKQPNTLILDETLGSLPIDVEGEIISRLRQIPDLTLVVISHREASACYADVVLNMKDINPNV